MYRLTISSLQSTWLRPSCGPARTCVARRAQRGVTSRRAWSGWGWQPESRSSGSTTPKLRSSIGTTSQMCTWWWRTMAVATKWCRPDASARRCSCQCRHVSAPITAWWEASITWTRCGRTTPWAGLSQNGGSTSYGAWSTLASSMRMSCGLCAIVPCHRTRGSTLSRVSLCSWCTTSWMASTPT